MGREAVNSYALVRLLRRSSKLLSMLALTGSVLAIPVVSGAATIIDFESLVNGEAGPFVFVTPDATVTITGSGPQTPGPRGSTPTSAAAMIRARIRICWWTAVSL